MHCHLTEGSELKLKLFQCYNTSTHLNKQCRNKYLYLLYSVCRYDSGLRYLVNISIKTNNKDHIYLLTFSGPTFFDTVEYANISIKISNFQFSDARPKKRHNFFFFQNFRTKNLIFENFPKFPLENNSIHQPHKILLHMVAGGWGSQNQKKLHPKIIMQSL